MALSLVSLAAPTSDGTGVPSSLAGLGRDKIFIVAGTYTGNATISIEVSGSADGENFVPLITARRPGAHRVEVAAMRARVVVDGYDRVTPFAPDIDVAAEEGSDDPVTVALVAPAESGAGAAVDVSAMPDWRSVYVTGTWSGSVVIEGSQDGTNWTQITPGFQRPGMHTARSAVRFLRVTRDGFDRNLPGTPTIHVVGIVTAGGGVEFGGAPPAVAAGGASDAGVAETAARSDHTHAAPAAAPAAPMGEDIEVIASTGTGGNFANGVSYVGLAATQAIDYQFIPTFTGFVELSFAYAMSVANAGDTTWTHGTLSIPEGADPAGALATGATFTVTPGADTLAHRIGSTDSATLRIAVTRGVTVFGRITRTGGTHTGDPRILQLQARQVA